MQVESLVSGGLLTAGPVSRPPDGGGPNGADAEVPPAETAERLLLRFSNSRARQFGAFAGPVAALQKGVVDDSLSGVRAVKAFGQEQQEIERFTPANDEVRGSELRTQRALASLFPPVAS